MKNQILTTEFEMASHFQAINQLVFSLVEVEDFLIVSAEEHDAQKTISHVPEEGEEGFVVCLPEGDRRDAKITAKMSDGGVDVKFKITSPDGGKIADFTMNTRHYLDVLMEIPESNPTPTEEMTWNVHCLKMGFKGILEGNEQFWFRFSENLNTLLQPVKKFIKQTPETYAQKILLGMDKESFSKAFFPPAPTMLQ